jgi:hypothetical protein
VDDSTIQIFTVVVSDLSWTEVSQVGGFCGDGLEQDWSSWGLSVKDHVSVQSIHVNSTISVSFFVSLPMGDGNVEQVVEGLFVISDSTEDVEVNRTEVLTIILEWESLDLIVDERGNDQQGFSRFVVLGPTDHESSIEDSVFLQDEVLWKFEFLRSSAMNLLLRWIFAPHNVGLLVVSLTNGTTLGPSHSLEIVLSSTGVERDIHIEVMHGVAVGENVLILLWQDILSLEIDSVSQVVTTLDVNVEEWEVNGRPIESIEFRGIPVNLRGDSRSVDMVNCSRVRNTLWSVLISDSDEDLVSWELSQLVTVNNSKWIIESIGISVNLANFSRFLNNSDDQ